jgi:hypothetical protein
VSPSVTKKDYDTILGILQSRHQAPQRREVEAWKIDVPAAFARLRYIQFRPGPPSHQFVVSLRAHVMMEFDSWDPVRSDVEKLWATAAEGVVRSVHTFEESGKRLIFRFACVTQTGSLVTGMILFTYDRPQ